MAKKVEAKPKREATKKGLKGEKKNAYVYGTLNKIDKAKKKTTRKKK